MEQLSYLLVGLFLLAVAAVSFIVGYRINYLSYEKMQRDLVDTYDRLWVKTRSLIEIKKKWYDISKHSIEVEQALKEAQREAGRLEVMLDGMKIANELIADEYYQAGIKDGFQKGKLYSIKKISGAMVSESVVLNEGGIVSKADPLINQVQNIKDGR